MQNLFLKKDYKTYLTVTLPNTSTWEVWITLNDSTDSDKGYLLLEPGTEREESIFYHRRTGNTVYCYGINRDNPVEHLSTAVVYMANSIDYMNYIISQTYEQTFIYKKDASHVIITGGSFYIDGENIIFGEVDTSAALTNKSLIANSNNYVYIKNGDYYITATADSTLMLVANIITALDGTITSILKYNTVTLWGKGEKGDDGDTGPTWPTGPTWATGATWPAGPTWATGSQGIQGIQWDTGATGSQGIQGIQGIKGDKGTIWRDAYAWGTAYVADDLVSYLGSTYICILASTGNLPTNGTYWDLFAQKGTDGAGAWDMLESVYDPTNKNADAFSMGNMDETATKKILTDTERTTIGTVASKEDSVNKSTSVTTDQASDTKYPSVKSVYDWASGLFWTISNLALKAPLASPTFTGNVAVPTPTLGTDAVNKTYADWLVIGLLDYRGGYDASPNTFPTTGWSWTAGAVVKGDMYIIFVIGTLWGTAVQIGDSIIANVDTPGQTAGNWNILNSNIAYVPEDVANKATTMTGNTASNTLYLTAKAIYDWVTTLLLASLTWKTTPVDADGVPIMDSAASNVMKFLTFTNLKVFLKTYFDTLYTIAWSLTVSWILELATTAEINTGTDSTRAMPVDQFVASNRNVRFLDFYPIEKATDNAVATNIMWSFECPFTGTITEIGAYVETAWVTWSSVWDVNINGATIMTTNKLSIDTAEVSTRSAATSPTLTTTAITVWDLITIDCDSLSTTKPKGLHVRIWIRLT